jgi:hypothetical protein
MSTASLMDVPGRARDRRRTNSAPKAKRPDGLELPWTSRGSPSFVRDFGSDSRLPTRTDARARRRLQVRCGQAAWLVRPEERREIREDRVKCRELSCRMDLADYQRLGGRCADRALHGCGATIGVLRHAMDPWEASDQRSRRRQ